MTKDECVIVTAFTGINMLQGEDIRLLYKYAEARAENNRSMNKQYYAIEFMDGETITVREDTFDVFAVIKNKKRKRR